MPSHSTISVCFFRGRKGGRNSATISFLNLVRNMIPHCKEVSFECAYGKLLDGISGTQTAWVYSHWCIPVFWCGDGRSRGDDLTVAWHCSRQGMDAQSNGLSATLSTGQHDRNSISVAERSTSHIRDGVVPPSAVGMETGGGNHRDPSPRRHHQPRQRRLAAWWDWCRHCWRVAPLPLDAATESRILKRSSCSSLRKNPLNPTFLSE